MDEFGEALEEHDIDYDEKRSFEQDWNNNDLFTENASGVYEYFESDLGKNASGVLGLSDNPTRNAYAQRIAGGEFRRDDDDGGHLIGARFNGSNGLENIDAQNSNLNRGAYKSLENEWADALNEGTDVFVNIDTYKQENSDRPDAFMGYAISELDDGERSFDVFSFQNESQETQEEWEKEIEDLELDDLI